MQFEDGKVKGLGKKIIKAKGKVKRNDDNTVMGMKTVKDWDRNGDKPRDGHFSREGTV
jgi:hypothetical protein